MAARDKTTPKKKRESERKEKLDRLVDDVRRDVSEDAEKFLKETEVREGGE